MSTALKSAPQNSLAALQSTMSRLDELASSAGLMITDGNPFQQAITMASGIVQLRRELTPEIMEEVFLPLMNCKLGFRTDKDPNRPVWNKAKREMVAPEPYPMATVRECLIEATLRGLPSVGNCWNIISAQSYVTKEGFWFLIGKRVPGLTDFKIHVGVPKMIRPPGDARDSSDDEAKGAVVACSASWKLNGKEDRTERDIPIRVNSMMGADAIMGKAERKILAAAYAQITGTQLGDADATESDTAPEIRTASGRVTGTAPTGEGFETVEPEPEAQKDDTHERRLLTEIMGALTTADVSQQSFEAVCRKEGLIPSGPGMLHTMDGETLAAIVERLPDLIGTLAGKGGAK